jgi:Cys-tRNA(Pro)/Cys-tRNA(Cys) deacylase
MLCESANVPFVVHEYNVSDGKISGLAAAEGKTAGRNVFVIPSNIGLDLKKAAAAAGDKYVEMIKSRELEPKTGYVHGGCSPAGMKKLFLTFIDETAQMHETINVSGRRIGLQIELPPDDIVRLTNAKLCDLF